MDPAIDISADYFDSHSGEMTIGYAIKKGTHYSISVAFRGISSTSGAITIAKVNRDYRPKTPIAIAACAHSGSKIAVASGVIDDTGSVTCISNSAAISFFFNIEYDIP